MSLALSLMFVPASAQPQAGTPKIASGIFEYEVQHSASRPYKLVWKISKHAQSEHCVDSTHLFFRAYEHRSIYLDFTQGQYYSINHTERTISLLNELKVPPGYAHAHRSLGYSSDYIPRLTLVDTTHLVAGVRCNYYIGDTLVTNVITNEPVRLYVEVLAARHVKHPSPIRTLRHVPIPLTIPNDSGLVLELKITKPDGRIFFRTHCTHVTLREADELEQALPAYTRVAPKLLSDPTEDLIPSRR